MRFPVFTIIFCLLFLPLSISAGTGQVHTRVLEVETLDPELTLPFIAFEISTELVIENHGDRMKKADSGENCLLNSDVEIAVDEYYTNDDTRCSGGVSQLKLESGEHETIKHTFGIFKDVTDERFENSLEQINGTITMFLESELSELTGSNNFTISWEFIPGDNQYSLRGVKNDYNSRTNATDEYPFSVHFQLSEEGEQRDYLKKTNYFLLQPFNLTTQILNTGNAFKKQFSSTCTGIGIDFDISDLQYSEQETGNPPSCGSMVTTVIVPGGLVQEEISRAILLTGPYLSLANLTGKLGITQEHVSFDNQEYTTTITMASGQITDIEIEENPINWNNYEVNVITTDIRPLNAPINYILLLLILPVLKQAGRSRFRR